MNAILFAAPIAGSLELVRAGPVLYAIGLVIAMTPVGLLIRHALQARRMRRAAGRLQLIAQRTMLRTSPA
jgi:cytochrome c biogenesis protein CcdA